MGYVVLKSFLDREEDHLYKVGNKYPREGSRPTKKRIAELASDKNAIGIPLIGKEEGKNANADGDLPVSQKLVQPKTRRK